MHFMKISSVLCVDCAAFSETCGPRNRTCFSDSHLLHILYEFIPQCLRHICWNPGDHSGYITRCIRSTPRGDTFDLPLRESQGTYDSRMLVFTLYRLHCMLIVFGKQSFFKSTWHLLHEILQVVNLTQAALSIWHDVLIEQSLCYFRVSDVLLVSAWPNILVVSFIFVMLVYDGTWYHQMCWLKSFSFLRSAFCVRDLLLFLYSTMIGKLFSQFAVSLWNMGRTSVLPLPRKIVSPWFVCHLCVVHLVIPQARANDLLISLMHGLN